MLVDLFLATVLYKAIWWVEKRTHIILIQLSRLSGGKIGALLLPFELFYHVLVMQYCVRKFLLVYILVQQMLYSVSNFGHIQDAVDIRSLTWIFLEAEGDEVLDDLGELRRNRWVPTIADLNTDVNQVLASPGYLQSYHLVKKYTKRPNVCRRVVRLTLNDLRGEIDWRAHGC